MQRCPSAELRDGHGLARDCLVDGKPLAAELIHQAELAAERDDACRLRGMLLTALAVLEELAPTDPAPEPLLACLILPTRRQRLDAILAGGAPLLQMLGDHTQAEYAKSPRRFAGRLCADSVMARRADEGRFAPMRWARSRPAATNWMIPKR